MHRRVVVVALAPDDLVLRIGELESRSVLDGPEEDDVLLRMKHVFEERLVGENGAHGSRLVPDDQLEQPETGPARGAKSRREHLTGDGRDLSGPKGFHRQQVGAVLVTERKPQQQILDGREADPLEVRGAARPDALHVLQRRREQIT